MARPFKAKTIRYPTFGALLLGWTLVGGMAYTRHLFLTNDPYGHILSDLSGWMTCYYPWVLLTPLVFTLERRLPLNRSRWPSHLGWLALAGLPILYVACEMTIALNAVVQTVLRQPSSLPTPWWSIPHCDIFMQAELYWFTVIGACVIRHLIEQQERERKSAQLALEKAELESSLRRAELETLRMRLNPHFLFNSLQNISILARQDPETASQMLARLGDLLRSALRKQAQTETTLAVEIGLTKAYAAIEQMRFGDRLSVLLNVESSVEQAMVPSLLLQPLVENAIMHGLREEKRIGVIWIRGIRQINQLVLTVSDNGSGPPKEKLADLEMGIGLGSTCERLEHMYPAQHNLSIQKLPEGGTEVRIILPLRFSESPTEVPAYVPTSTAHRR
jgi:two-component system LytT family sensor kinase